MLESTLETMRVYVRAHTAVDRVDGYTFTQSGVASSELSSLNTKNSKLAERSDDTPHTAHRWRVFVSYVRSFVRTERGKINRRGKVLCCCCLNIQVECRNAFVVCINCSVEPGIAAEIDMKK